MINGIKTRFDQPGYKMYVNLENLLSKSCKAEPSDLVFQQVTDFYGSVVTVLRVTWSLAIWPRGNQSDAGKQVRATGTKRPVLQMATQTDGLPLG